MILGDPRSIFLDEHVTYIMQTLIFARWVNQMLVRLDGEKQL